VTISALNERFRPLVSIYDRFNSHERFRSVQNELNASIILLLLVYLIGEIFCVNLKFQGQNSCVNLIKKRQFIQENFLFFKYTFLNFRNF
jgi:hypothetical protein